MFHELYNSRNALAVRELYYTNYPIKDVRFGVKVSQNFLEVSLNGSVEGTAPLSTYHAQCDYMIVNVKLIITQSSPTSCHPEYQK